MRTVCKHYDLGKSQAQTKAKPSFKQPELVCRRGYTDKGGSFGSEGPGFESREDKPSTRLGWACSRYQQPKGAIPLRPGYIYRAP